MHLAKQLLQLIAFRRRALRLQDLIPDHILDRADEADLRAEGPLEDVLEQIGRGGLSVRTGHADHRHMLRRPAEPVGRHERQRPPRRWDDDIRNVRLRHPLTEDRSRAALHSLRDEPVPVGSEAGHSNEQFAVLCAAGIIADAGHFQFRVGMQFRNLNILQQIFQFHVVSPLESVRSQSAEPFSRTHRQS